MEFTCPYCNRPTTITSPNQSEFWQAIDITPTRIEHAQGLGLGCLAIACPNPKCKKIYLTVRLTESVRAGTYSTQLLEADEIREWQLLPESSAKPQPSYIPTAIVNDYTEACRIRDLSSKAAAALARRCLQGMIRDFHGIKKDRLSQEVNELQGKIPRAEWTAISSLKAIGNIGAHMEKDVNLIVDIDPKEADRLIAFIEYLFQQWYVKRHDDEENLAEIQKIAGIKMNERKGASKSTQ